MDSAAALWQQQQQQQQQQHGIPTQQQHGSPPLHTPLNNGGPRKRRKSSALDGHDLDNSDENDTPASGQRGRTQGVKRACNECRQQKLRCDVVTEPEYQPCKRCIKHNLMCAIDPGFKRQEKRQQYAELERELQALRAENAELKSGLARGTLAPVAQMKEPSSMMAFSASPTSQFGRSKEDAATRSLLDLASGYDSSYIASARVPGMYTLAKVNLREEQVRELFDIFFSRFHPYLPLLSPDIPPATYFELSPLLYWTIITVAARRYDGRGGLLSDLKPSFHELLWDTIGCVPQTYHVVKALCLLCAWPLPTSSTSLDPSMIICGAMVELSMQFGLHRPSHAQDFSRIKLELREEDIKDRMGTWAAVNICAQNVSTGYGMPQISRWNWFTHGIHLNRISPALRNRCMIERFSDKITRTMYTMQRDLIVQTDETHRALTIDMFAREYEELESSIKQQNPLPMDFLHLHIAALHLRLTAFFDSPSAPTYRQDLSALYVAATTLLKTFLGLPTDIELPRPNGKVDLASPPASPYATNHIMQMVLAAGFTLMKLLNSFFASQVDTVSGRTIFLQTVSALRSISVVQNDLPQRLAEVLAQLWQASGAGGHRLFDDNGSKPEVDDSLQIKIRCRMSMSLVYDSIWRWKERFGGTRNLDRMVEHPTEPDDIAAAAAAQAASAATGLSMIGNTATSLMDPHSHLSSDAAAAAAAAAALSSGLNGSGGVGYVSVGGEGDLGMEGWDTAFGSAAPFDSLGWALDGFLEMPIGNGGGGGGLDGGGQQPFS